MCNLLAHANEQVNRYNTFLVDFDKNYIRPIQIQQQSIFSMVKDYKSYCLPRSSDKIVRSKILTAPLLADIVWNIPSECEKALIDLNKKWAKFFVVDVSVTDPQIEDIDIPKAFPEDPDPLRKRQAPPNFLANRIQNNISAWKEVV